MQGCPCAYACPRRAAIELSIGEDAHVPAVMSPVVRGAEKYGSVKKSQVVFVRMLDGNCVHNGQLDASPHVDEFGEFFRNELKSEVLTPAEGIKRTSIGDIIPDVADLRDSDGLVERIDKGRHILEGDILNAVFFEMDSGCDSSRRRVDSDFRFASGVNFQWIGDPALGLWTLIRQLWLSHPRVEGRATCS